MFEALRLVFECMKRAEHSRYRGKHGRLGVRVGSECEGEGEPCRGEAAPWWLIKPRRLDLEALQLVLLRSQSSFGLRTESIVVAIITTKPFSCQIRCRWPCGNHQHHHHHHHHDSPLVHHHPSQHCQSPSYLFSSLRSHGGSFFKACTLCLKLTQHQRARRRAVKVMNIRENTQKLATP